ncbi:MAG: sensor histidine kinase [Anaerotignaceae bacterium]
MGQKINKLMIMIGILSMVITTALMIFIFHKTIDRQIKDDLYLTAKTLAVGYNYIHDYEDLSQYKGNGFRITLVSKDGEVLFESDATTTQMVNHGSREEITNARKTGTGEAIRNSETLGVLTYYFALLLDDGNVLRIGLDATIMYSVYSRTMPTILAMGVFITIICIFTGRILTRKLVAPIEAMAERIDDIDKDVPYKELEPFAIAVKEHQTKKAEIGKIRQEFTANVSHELKTPLTSISGYAEMIKSGMVKDSDIKEFAGKIHLEAGRLIRLIGEILKLSELDEPHITESFETVDLYNLALNTVEMLKLKASKSNIVITVTGNESIIKGNKTMLEELVFNLCDNAIRYNKKGGTVKVEVNKSGSNIVFTVKDNGIGISKENQERIFERFYRVDKSRSKETGGTGLGLAIVKHIALQHNAKIIVNSQMGLGTTMKVVFELVEA